MFWYMFLLCLIVFHHCYSSRLWKGNGIMVRKFLFEADTSSLQSLTKETSLLSSSKNEWIHIIKDNWNQRKYHKIYYFIE